MSVMSILTKNIVETNYENLPADVVLATKKVILDTLSVILAGSKSTDVRRLVELVTDWDGKKESTIIGFGVKVPCCDAALVNGFSASCLDYDDFHEIDLIRTSQSIIPAALAIVERQGGINGRDFIAAVASGFDLACRLSKAAVKTDGIKNRLGAHSAKGYLSAPNIFGGAAICGKLLGLSEEQLKNALGIALMQLTSEGWAIGEGLNIKGLEPGCRAKASVLAALLAEKDFEGPSDPIEGLRGFYDICYQKDYQPELITAGLGKDFEITTNSQRAYPCGFVFNAAVSAAIALAKEKDIRPDEIAEVVLYLGPVLQHTCEPLEKKRNPRSTIAAQHSLPWLVAKAILNRKLGLEHFTDEQIKDPKTLELASKVIPQFDPELGNAPFPEPAVVEVKTVDGIVHMKKADSAPGGYYNPMSFDEVAEKFRDSCLFAAKPVTKENQEEVIRIIRNLENINDVSKIPGMLV